MLQLGSVDSKWGSVGRYVQEHSERDQQHVSADFKGFKFIIISR